MSTIRKQIIRKDEKSKGEKIQNERKERT